MLEFLERQRSYGDDIWRMFGGTAKNVTFITTHYCDFQCSYCYERCKSNVVMPLEIAKKAIDMLFAEDDQNSQYVNAEAASGIVLDFIGGEPLLTIDLIDQICDYFLYIAIDRNHRWATRFMISISSNGSHYFQPNVQAFMRKWVGRVNIGITIDGSKELHDSCRRTVTGDPTYDMAAAAFADARVRFNQSGTKLTLSQSNLKYLYAACVDMIEKFDLTSLHGNPVFEDVWTIEDAALYYSELKKLADWMIDTGRWKKTHLAFFDDFIGHQIPAEDNKVYCGGSGLMLAFDVDGSIYPCVRYSPITLGEEKASKCVVGHVDTGLVKRECEQCFMGELCASTRRSMSTDECFNCPIGSGCATCSAWQYDKYGTADKRCTNICHMHKARVLATSYFYNTLYRKYGEPNRFALNIPADWAIPIVGENQYQMLLSYASED